MACLLSNFEDLQGVGVASTVVRSWDQNVPDYLGPQYAGLER